MANLTGWITVLSSLLGLVAALLSIYGAARTQRVLGQAKERDRVIDALAWADRKLFHGEARSPRS